MINPAQQNNQSLVLFRVGPVLCCAPSQPVLSIIIPPPLNRPPGSTETQPGVFRYSDTVFRVIDLRYGFGVSSSQHKMPGRFVLATMENQRIAFWIDEIIDVIERPDTGWGSHLPAQLPKGVFSRTLIRNDRIHLYAEFEKLLQIRSSGYLRTYIETLEKAAEKKADPVVLFTAKPDMTGKTGMPASKQDRNSIAEETQTAPDKTTREVKPEALSPVSASQENPAGSQSSNQETLVQRTSIPPRTTPGPAHTSASVTPVKVHTAKPAVPLTTSTVKHQASSSEKQRQTRTPQTPTPWQTSRSTLTTGHFKTPSSPQIQDDNPLEDEGLGVFAWLIALVVLLLLGGAVSLFVLLLSDQPATPVAVMNSKPVQASPVPQREIWKSSTKTEPASVQQATTTAPSEQEPAVAEKPQPAVAPLEPTREASSYSEPNMLSRDPLSQATGTNLPAAGEPASQQEVTRASEQLIPPHSMTETAGSLLVESEKPRIDPPAAANSDAASVQAEYHAEILQDRNEVTLNLLETVTESSAETSADDVGQTTSADQADVTAVNLDTDRPASSPSTANKSATKPKQQIRSTILKITHIVVEGDTLWAIAKKYVNDPYRYPELARLSKISNPDRIYPGNRIHINFERITRKK